MQRHIIYVANNQLSRQIIAWREGTVKLAERLAGAGPLDEPAVARQNAGAWQKPQLVSQTLDRQEVER